MVRTEAEFLWRYGHFRNPAEEFEASWNVTQDDLGRLSLYDEEFKLAVRSFQQLDVNCDVECLRHHHRSLNPDGLIGSATRDVMLYPRCGTPDHGDSTQRRAGRLVGAGNWARCHDVGNFHSASVEITNAHPTHVAENWEQIRENVIRAYADVGLLFHFDGREPVNIQFSYVGQSDGWIGLAIVSNDSTCRSRAIWCRYLSRYTGGATNTDIITQWTSLIKHELGHNCGMGHTRGGVMNPSVIRGLPVLFGRSDPARQLLINRFGGEPVPRDDPPDPDPPEERKLVIAWRYPDNRFEVITEVDADVIGKFPPGP